MHKFQTVILSVAILICSICGGMVSQAEQVHILRMKFITESGPVMDSTFKVYYAMTLDGVLTEDFEQLSVEVGDLNDSENVNRLAFTLASYTASGVGTPIAQGITNGLGYVDFENLPIGIYLVTGSSGTIGDFVYTPKPALIIITSDSEEMIEAGVKYTVVAGSSDMAYAVKKVWAVQDGAEYPQSVTVQLFKSGELYDEVVLNAENNWFHTWQDLSSDYDWYVIEKDIPSNYSVSITLDSSIFTIENKSTNPPGPSDTSSDTDVTPPTETEPTVTETSGTEPEPSDTTTVSSVVDGGNTPDLPYTGQLWYPVPILFAAGALLFLVGFIAGRLGEDHEKE